MTPGDQPATSSSFRLVRELGRGGMGVVHEAQEVASGRRVALKILSPDIEYTDETYRRFEREARLAASVSHPRCVFVLGAHQHDGSPAIAMELMSGETLADRVGPDEPAPIVTAVRWILDVLEGLAAAHRAGVIHRDVKPSNCFLTADGRIKVGDFGLARALTRDLRLTQSGQFLGSPLYASPEQVRGDDVDVRTDVYSVGATLYTLLAGRPAFEGSGLGEVLSRILTEDPPPLWSLRRDVPRGLARIVRRAMQRDPRKRYADLGGLAAALRPWAGRGRTPARGLRLRAALVDAGMILLSLFGWTLVVTALVVGLRGPDDDTTGAVVGFEMSVLLLLVLAYHPVVEGLRGASRGKRLYGLRVVAHTSGLPSGVRTAVRGVLSVFLFFAFVTLLVIGLRAVFPESVPTGFPLLAFPLATALLFVTARRRSGFRGVHEILSGTRVVADEDGGSDGRDGAALLTVRPGDAGDEQATIGDWRVEGVIGPTPMGRLLAAHDDRLDRSVWLDVGAASGAPVRPADANPARLHLLDSGQDGERTFTVYEDPGGAAVVHYAESGKRLAWPVARDVLAGLVDVLGHADPPTSREQVWIDREQTVRFLDRPLGPSEAPKRGPLAILADVTRDLLAPGGTPPPDLPLHAEALVVRLAGEADPFPSLQEVRAALEDLKARPAQLTQRMLNLTRLFVVAAVPFVLLFSGAVGEPAAEPGRWAPFLLVYGLLATPLAFLLRGGFGLLLAGIGVRTAEGPRASRLRCAARSALTWAPGCACLYGADVAKRLDLDPTVSWVFAGAAVVLLIATAVLSSRIRSVSPQDLIAGTRLVPR